MSGPNLYKELKELLQGRDPTKPDKNRLGRVGFLRKFSAPKSKVSATGEYDPSDYNSSEGSDYLDYKVLYYRATATSAEIKDTLGRLALQQEVIYMLAEKGMPQATNRDKLVEIQHELDGTPTLVDGEYVMAKMPIAIDSVIEYWGDNDGEMVLYVLKPDNPTNNNVSSGVSR